MSDVSELIERLRTYCHKTAPFGTNPSDLLEWEAADALERLATEKQQALQGAGDWHACCVSQHAEIGALKTDNDRLAARVETLEKQQEDILASFYVIDEMSLAVAKLCDEQLDRSGALLGRVRDKAYKAKYGAKL